MGGGKLINELYFKNGRSFFAHMARWWPSCCAYAQPMLLFDIPAWGLVGPRRMRDRFLVLSLILMSASMPIAVLYALSGLLPEGDPFYY